MYMPVRNFVNMYIHVCTMYRDVCTDLPILVQVVRIPDGMYQDVLVCTMLWYDTDINRHHDKPVYTGTYFLPQVCTGMYFLTQVYTFSHKYVLTCTKYILVHTW